MMEIAERLQFQENCVILPNFPIKEAYSDEEICVFRKMHKEKIKISDAIFVVNIGGYIGDATKSEIELAQTLNKEIIYYYN